MPKPDVAPDVPRGTSADKFVWDAFTIVKPKTPAPLDLGGPGSGNFGHAGRPGEVGGSASESSATPVVIVTPRPGTGRFATENNRLYAKIEVQARLQRLIPGVARIEAPDVNLIHAGEQVATVLSTMQKDGLEMPHHIAITYVDPLSTNQKINAKIAGYTITDPSSGASITKKDLTIELPKTLPPDTNLDAAVAAVFGAPSHVIPKHVYNDTQYTTYDRFVARTMKDVIVHEMGHVQAGHRSTEDATFPMSTLLQSGRFGSTDAIRRAALRVSEYALTNQNEFLAEAFTRLYRGETLADDSQKLYDALDGPKVPTR